MKAGLLITMKRLLMLLCLVPSGFMPGLAESADLDLAQAPLGNAYGGAPNVMLLIDTSRSMHKPVHGGTEIRIDAARRVAQELVKDNPKVRFGLTRLNGWHGGIIDCPIGNVCVGYTDNAGNAYPAGESLTVRLDRYKLETLTRGTPITEAMYEVTRYFRSMKSFNYYALDPRTDSRNPIVDYRELQYEKPEQYSCQKNNVIVLTDGKPVNDNNLPDGEIVIGEVTQVDPFDEDTEGAALPDWDRDGRDQTDSGKSIKGQAWYLDDLALFAWDLPENIRTYTVGFATDFTMLKRAADYGKGKYYTAESVDQLSTVLTQAINAIKSEPSSSSAVAANSGRVQNGSRIFQARYDASDWSGQLLAYDIITDSAVGDVGQLDTSGGGDGEGGSVWEANNKIPDYDRRVIITNNNEKGIKFRWGKFNSDDQRQLFNNKQELLKYLRGKSVSDYRQRSSKLGDIVNSAPVYVGQPDARYRDNIETTSYKSFRQKYRARAPIVYVGANDGMLHGFDATSGAEKLAYIPGHLLPKLKHLANKDYSHQYYVDGSPTVVDAFVGGEWKTILVGGLNAGGQSVYALDVTNPERFSHSNASSLFMWEFSDKDNV